MSFRDDFETYCAQEHLRTEGRRGVEALCKIAGALGYNDSLRFGQLTSTTCVGDLLEMLQDNPGLVEAMFTWVGKQRSPEWQENIRNQLSNENLEGDPDEHDEQ